MKNYLLLLFLLVTNFIIGQEFESASNYLDFISKEQETIFKSTWRYTKAVSHGRSNKKIDKTRKALLRTIENSKHKIAALKKGYKGDIEFRDQILSYFSFTEKLITEDYDKIIDMNQIANQSDDYIDAYVMIRDWVSKKNDDELKAFNANREKFALKNNLLITENISENYKKIKVSNEVFDSHTELYLLFFKANITDINLFDSTESKDLNTIQQNLNSLELFANQGLEKLKEIKPYKNDSSFINATKKALEFYRKEALNYGPSVISFIMLNQKNDDTKRIFDKKTEKNRTNEEVANFNDLTNKLYKETRNYEILNYNNFNEKNTVLKEWNSASENFISKHVPKN